MDITGLIVGLVIGNITGFVIGTIYVVGTVKKNLARFGKDTMENFFRDATAMSDPTPVIETELEVKPEVPIVRNPVSRPSEYVPKHKERKP